MLSSSAIFLATFVSWAAAFALPIPQPSIDLNLRVQKPLPNCHCETLNNIPICEQTIDCTHKINGTPETCLDFCIWKLGRRTERRRIEGLMRYRGSYVENRAERVAVSCLEKSACRTRSSEVDSDDQGMSKEEDRCTRSTRAVKPTD